MVSDICSKYRGKNSYRWYQFGLKLDVEVHVLKEIQANNSTHPTMCANCFTDVIDYWLKNSDTNEHWQDLKRAEEQLDLEQSAEQLDIIIEQSAEESGDKKMIQNFNVKLSICILSCIVFSSTIATIYTRNSETTWNMKNNDFKSLTMFNITAISMPSGHSQFQEQITELSYICTKHPQNMAYIYCFLDRTIYMQPDHFNLERSDVIGLLESFTVTAMSTSQIVFDVNTTESEVQSEIISSKCGTLIDNNYYTSGTVASLVIVAAGTAVTCVSFLAFNVMYNRPHYVITQNIYNPYLLETDHGYQHPGDIEEP